MTDKQRRDKVAHAIRDANKLAEQKGMGQFSRRMPLNLKQNDEINDSDTKSQLSCVHHDQTFLFSNVASLSMNVSHTTIETASPNGYTFQMGKIQGVDTPNGVDRYQKSTQSFQNMNSRKKLNVEQTSSQSNNEPLQNLFEVGTAFNPIDQSSRYMREESSNRVKNYASWSFNPYPDGSLYDMQIPAFASLTNEAQSPMQLQVRQNCSQNPSSTKHNMLSELKNHTRISLHDQVMAEPDHKFSIEAQNDSFVKVIEWTLGKLDNTHHDNGHSNSMFEDDFTLSVS